MIGDLAKVVIQVQGLEALNKKLKELPVALQKKIVRKALRAGAKIQKTQAKAKAPAKSGLLKKAINIKAGKKRKPGKLSVFVGPAQNLFMGETFYAGFVEFGHRQVQGKTDTGKEVKPHPFMAPAFEATKGAMEAAIIDTMWDEIAKAMN